MEPIISQQSEQSYSPLPEPKHFLNKKFIVTAVVLLLLGGTAYGGIWYWQKQQVAQEAVPTATPRVDETAGWKTYTNTQYGFEIKYPTEKYLLNASDGIDYENTILQSKFAPDTDMSVYFKVQIENRPFEIVRQSLKKVIAGSEPVESVITFAGESGYVYVEKYPSTNEDGSISVSLYEILIKHNGNIYYILTQKYNLNEVKQILSTFKFTDSTVGVFCGGIAGKSCPSGYSCKLEGTYPDAGGTCIKNAVACTMEAKQCSDGSYVGRTGPNCEFVCPK